MPRGMPGSPRRRRNRAPDRCPNMPHTGIAAAKPEPASGPALEHAPGHVGFAMPPAPRPRIAPLAPERYAVQFTTGQSTYELLQRAEDLAGHRLSSEEMDRIFALGLQSHIASIEKRRFGATDRPRRSSGPVRGRGVPAAVRREVTARDGARCTSCPRPEPAATHAGTSNSIMSSRWRSAEKRPS